MVWKQDYPWPVEPLMKFAHLDTGASLAKAFHVSWDMTRRWHEHGLSDHEADRMAVTRLGVLPSDIWTDWFEWPDKLEILNGIVRTERTRILRFVHGHTSP